MEPEWKGTDENGNVIELLDCMDGSGSNGWAAGNGVEQMHEYERFGEQSSQR